MVQAAAAIGKFVSNQGEGRFAPVSRADCAAAAAGALTATDPLEQTYDITGPELVSAADQARIYGELGATEVERTPGIRTWPRPWPRAAPTS